MQIRRGGNQRLKLEIYYLNLKKIAKRQGAMQSLGVGLSLLLTSFFLIFALKPRLTKIAELKKQIEVEQKTLKQLEKKTTTLAKVEGIWSRIQDPSQQIEKSIPLGPDYSYWVKEIEWVAQSNQVKYINGTFSASLIKSDLINPYQLGSKLDPIEIKVSLRFEGDYPNLLATVNQLMQLDRVFDVGEVRISENDKKDSLGQLVMTVGGKVYYFGNKAELDKVLNKNKKRR